MKMFFYVLCMSTGLGNTVQYNRLYGLFRVLPDTPGPAPQPGWEGRPECSRKEASPPHTPSQQLVYDHSCVAVTFGAGSTQKEASSYTINMKLGILQL